MKVICDDSQICPELQPIIWGAVLNVTDVGLDQENYAPIKVDAVPRMH